MFRFVTKVCKVLLPHLLVQSYFVRGPSIRSMNVLEHEQHCICEGDAYDVDREILYTIASAVGSRGWIRV